MINVINNKVEIEKKYYDDLNTIKLLHTSTNEIVSGNVDYDVTDVDFKKHSIVDIDRPKLCADRLDGVILTGLFWTKGIDILNV